MTPIGVIPAGREVTVVGVTQAGREVTLIGVTPAGREWVGEAPKPGSPGLFRG